MQKTPIFYRDDPGNFAWRLGGSLLALGLALWLLAGRG